MQANVGGFEIPMPDPFVVSNSDGFTDLQKHRQQVSELFIAAAESGIRHEVMNIVAEETVTIRELAEMVVAECPAPLSFGEPRPGDISPARVSADKARDLLGWTARVPFAEGLRELIAHHRDASR